MFMINVKLLLTIITIKLIIMAEVNKGKVRIKKVAEFLNKCRFGNPSCFIYKKLQK